jgi:hypothetical protein
MEIFKNNTYFYGLTIPDPGAIVPLEKKVPTEMATAEGMKFLKVVTCFFIEILMLQNVSDIFILTWGKKQVDQF